MISDDLLVLKAYVDISTYRAKTIKAIGNETKIPSVIAKDCDILPNHISKVLKELKDNDLVVCINETARKGRLYRLTDKGKEVLEVLEWTGIPKKPVW